MLVLLFCFNNKICFYFYPEDVNGWWTLRTNIYSVMFAGLFYANKLQNTVFSKFMFSIGIGLTISDFIDRIFFDINQFTTSDIFMIIITISIASFEYFYATRRSEGTNS